MTVFKAKKLMGLFPFQGITKSSLGLGSIVREKAKNRVKTKNKKMGEQSKPRSGLERGEGRQSLETCLWCCHSMKAARSDWSNV